MYNNDDLYNNDLKRSLAKFKDGKPLGGYQTRILQDYMRSEARHILTLKANPPLWNAICDGIRLFEASGSVIYWATCNKR
jgi:hypothetical protein